MTKKIGAPRRNVTPADKAAAEKLRALWDQAKERSKGRDDQLTQGRMAETLAAYTGKGSQGAISQYLRGEIALNYKALLAFASEIGCAPEDIRNDLPEQKAARAALHQADDSRSPGMVKSHAENDIDALAYAVSALFASLGRERPVEGARLAASMRKAIPAEFVHNGIVKKLIATLEKAARKARIDQPAS